MTTPDVIVFSPSVALICFKAQDLGWEVVSRGALRFRTPAGEMVQGCTSAEQMRGRPRGTGFWFLGENAGQALEALTLAQASGFKLWTPGVTL